MADVYLVANSPYSASDVILAVAASSGSAVASSAGGMPNPLPEYRPPRRRDNDDEDVLVAALI